MRDRFAELRARDLDVVVVLCQKSESVASWLAAAPLPFPVLIDADRSRAKRWGAYVRLSYDSVHIARPASFVVDAAGILRYARVSKHQWDAPPLEDILALAEAVRTGGETPRAGRVL